MYRFFKRFLDIVLSLIAIIVLFPVYIFAFIGVKASSKGPALYISIRTKKDYKDFKFYKFRSMHITDKDKGLFVEDKDRLFAFGKFIRKTKIDELPQLFNVLKGDMSIVGPRPMQAENVDKIYCGKYKEVLTKKPGLTSAASLYDYIVGDEYTDNEKYISDILPIKCEMELLYVRKQSFHYDASLVFRTIIAILAAIFGKKNKIRIKELKMINENKETIL